MTKERPILFSGAMVRAILDGRKTQTRRVVKPQPPAECSIHFMLGNESWLPPTDRAPLRHHWEAWGGPLFDSKPANHLCGSHAVKSPYGAPSERLWVKETFFAFGRWETRFNAKKARDEWHFVDITTDAGREYQYPDSHASVATMPRGEVTPSWWKRPAIFMPRAASRILLEIGSMRVERLNECSEADAVAEGCGANEAEDACGNYRLLWNSINGAGAWEANPWVWVVEFRRIER